MPRSLRGRTGSPPLQIAPRYERSSPRKRGYTGAWDKASAGYRRKHPFCAWCAQQGRITLCEVVDHKIPIVDGGEMFDRSLWWGLCRPHHDLKGQMETFARKTGQVQMLTIWCDEPDKRPAKFRA